MARPQKKRLICCMPEQDCFSPEGNPAGEVQLTIDEYETIRLIDLEGNTQEECSRQMQVSRTTVQSIYNTARYKLADAIVNGKKLMITGGDYRLCELYGQQCRRSCRRRGCCPRINNCIPNTLFSGGIHMKIAVTYDNGQIFQHFGHTQQFKIYDIQDGKIAGAQVVDTMGSGHGALAGFLSAHQVDALICGGIGGGAQVALREAGITLYGGVSGLADDAVAALLANNLQYNPAVQCNHHEHGHEGHSCGSHEHGSCHGHDDQESHSCQGGGCGSH